MLGGVFTASWIIAGVAVLATVACLLTIPTLGPAPGNPWAASILYILAPGLLIPFSLFMLSRAGTYWLDENGEIFRPTGTKLASRMGISVAYVLVGLAASMAGLAPFEDFLPGSWDRGGDWFVVAFAIGAETGWIPDFHHGVLGHWLTGLLGTAAVATVIWWGLGFLALAGMCVLAAWIPLQLPMTSGQATEMPAAEKKQRPRQVKKRRRGA